MYKVYLRVMSILLAAVLIASMLVISACTDKSQVYLEKGDEFSTSGQWDEAINEYGKAIDDDPDLALAYFGRAKAYLAKEDYELAIYDLNTVIEVTDDPNLILNATQMIENIEADVLTIILENIAASVSEIRGLVPKHDVDYLVVTPEEMPEKLLNIFETKYSQEEVAIDQEVYELFGLLDEGQDFYNILHDLYSQPVVSLYDHETDKLYIVGDVSIAGPMERVSLAHEYTNALQDQYFDLSTLLLDSGNNSDKVRAAQALIEGDASLTSSEFMQQELSSAEREAAIAELEESEIEKYKNTPRFLKEVLLFPYVEGEDFVTELGDWEAVNLAYADPPQSTSEILHPDKCVGQGESGKVVISDLGEHGMLGQWEEGWAEYDRDVLGEFGLKAWLETYVDSESAVNAAQGWYDDTYVYYKNDIGETLLISRSNWDSEEDAKEFFDAFIEYMDNRDDVTWELTYDLTEYDRRWDKDGLIVSLIRRGKQACVLMPPNEAIGGFMWRAFSWAMESADYPEPTPGSGG